MTPDHAGARRSYSQVQAVILLCALVIAYIVAYLDRQIIALLVESIKVDLQISDFHVSLLQGLAFALTFCLGALPVGWLVDRHSRRNVLVSGILIWSIGTVLCGLSGSFGMLFAARMAVGLGEAFLAPAAYGMIVDAFSRDRIVRALSIYTMAATLGVGAAFLAGSSVIDLVAATPSLAFGLSAWQAAFVLISLPGFAIVLPFLLIREPPRTETGAKDVPSVAEVMRYLMRNWQGYLPIYLCAGLLGITYYTGFAWYAAHLVRTQGFTPQGAGYLLGILFLSTCSIGTVLGVSLSEWFQRRGRTDAPMHTVFLLSLVAIIGSAYAAVDNLYVSVTLLIIESLALGSFYGNLVAALQMLSPDRMRGVNSALFTLWSALISIACGPTIIGFLSSKVFPDRADGLGLSMAIVCLATTIGSAIVAFGGRRSFARAIAQTP